MDVMPAWTLDQIAGLVFGVSTRNPTTQLYQSFAWIIAMQQGIYAVKLDAACTPKQEDQQQQK
jgi:hypothetical protein